MADIESPVEQAALESSPYEDDAFLVKTYYQRFRTAETGVANKHKMFKTLDMFDRGEQWKDANIPPWIPKPVTNMVRYIRILKRSNLASDIPTCSYTPLYEEDKPDIEMLEAAYKHVWEWEHIPRVIRRAIDRGNLFGTSIAYVYEDTSYVGGKYYGKGNGKNQLFQGRICVKLWPITNFFPDPDAYSLDMCKFVETTEILPRSTIVNNPVYRKYVKENYPDNWEDLLDNFKGDNVDREDDSDGTIFDRDNKPNYNLTHVRGDEMITVHCHWERFLDKDGKWKLNASYYTKNNNFFLLRSKDIKPNRYPFEVYYDEEEDQDFWGTSLCLDVLENQKVINKVDQTASIIATMHQNPQKIVTRSSGINAQEMARTGTVPGKTWTSNDGDPAKSIHFVQPPDIPKGLYEMKDRMTADIKETTGVSSVYTGEHVGSLTTSTGVNTLIDRATIRDKDKMLQIDAFVEGISDLIVRFILHKWRTKRPLAVPQPDGTPDFKTFEPINEDHIDNLEWLVRCDTFAQAPATEAQKSQEADNLMQMQGQFNFQPAIITPQEWIMLKGFKDKALMLQRMKKDAEILAQQQAQQTPKINPTGDIQISLATKDQNVIYSTLEDMMRQAMANQQQATALMMAHTDNGVNVAPGTGQASAADQSAPTGNAGSQAMQNMMRGR